MQSNLAGIDPALLGRAPVDLAGFDMPRFLAQLTPADSIAARHTVGLLDAIGGHPGQVSDGLPESLEEVVATYGHRYFKLKVGGNLAADQPRLIEIASVLDRIAEPYFVSLDGNEQYDDIGALLELWRRMEAAPQLKRLVASILFIEQPITRACALDSDVSSLSQVKPVIIDESDDGLGVFPRARDLGYLGVSSKCCKGLYKSILNACPLQPLECPSGHSPLLHDRRRSDHPGGACGSAGSRLGQLARHAARRTQRPSLCQWHGWPAQAEQTGFLAAHPDLYEQSYGAVRLKIRNGRMEFGSLAGARICLRRLSGLEQIGATSHRTVIL